MKERSARIIFTIYLGLICLAFLCVYVTENTVFLIVATGIAFMVFYLISGPVLSLFGKGAALINPIKRTKRSQVIVFTISTFVCLAVMMIWFVGYFPGSFQGDCIAQYRQAITSHYDDWHPVWHTLLFYTFPLSITGGAVWAPAVFQMICFSLATGVVSCVLYRYAGTGICIVGFLYMILNPYTGQFMLYPWKDAAFAITLMLVMAMVLVLWFEGGDCRGSRLLCILLGFAMANATIFRHNGILFTGFLILALLLSMDIRRWLYILITFILTLAIIKGPVYSIVNADRIPQPVIQKVGVPMNIIANVAAETPDRLDPKTADFVYSIAPADVWENEYQLGNFGVIKYYADIDETPVENAGTGEICGMAFKSFVNSPVAAFRALFATTDIVYGPDIMDEGYIGAQIESNDLGLVQTGNDHVASVLETYYKIARLHGYDFLRQSACSLLFILCMLLAVCRFSDKYDRKKILICMSVFAYNFGTMLLLTGPDSRFFYATYLICPMVMVLAGFKQTGPGTGSEAHG